MALQLINIGSAPNDGTGDPIRTAYAKCNANFLDLYSNQVGGIVPNVYYVAKNGDDSSAGNALGEAFLTIKRAVQVATAYLTNNPGERVCIFVKSGDYIEDNPIVCPRNLTIWGDNLRSVSVRPLNPTQDIFHVQNGDYITGMTFRDHISGAAAVAFPTSGAGVITTSPYIQNCSSITTTGVGMRVDGNLAGGLKSMVTDAYTQINQGGKGIVITNQGYAQLVSIFTICCNEGILVENGGTCSVTNSNTSFGTYGLVARGKVLLPNAGFTNGVNQTGRFIVIDGLTERPNVNQAVSFDNGTTLYNVWNATALVGGQSVIELGEDITTGIPDNTPAKFYIRSTITTSSHTFEYVGTGDVLVNALPQTGALPVEANEIVTSDGGEVIYTSTDQRGNFKIGDNLVINGIAGTISGDTFDKSLFAVMTPYILAIEG